MAGYPGQSHPNDGGAGGGGGGPDGGGGNHADGDKNGFNGNDGIDVLIAGASRDGGGGSAGNGYASFTYDDTYGVLWEGGDITIENGRITHTFFLPGVYKLTSAL